MVLIAVTLLVPPMLFSVYRAVSAYSEASQQAVVDAGRFGKLVARALASELTQGAPPADAVQTVMRAVAEADDFRLDFQLALLNEEGDALAAYGTAPARASKFSDVETVRLPIPEHQLVLRIDIAREHWTWLTTPLLVGVLLPSLMLALVVAAIAIATEFLVNKHIRALSVAANELQAGQYALRPSLPSAPVEIRDLATALGSLAEAVERRQRSLEQNIVEKDILLREIHHRIKNNIQSISGIIGMQQRRTTDNIASSVLRMTSLYIQAIAIAHRGYYAEAARTDIALLPYMDDLTVAAQRLSNDLIVRLEPSASAARLALDIDRLMALGLLIVETIGKLAETSPSGEQTVIISLHSADGRMLERLTITSPVGDRSTLGNDRLIQLLASQAGDGSGWIRVLQAVFPWLSISALTRARKNLWNGGNQSASLTFNQGQQQARRAPCRCFARMSSH